MLQNPMCSSPAGASPSAKNGTAPLEVGATVVETPAVDSPPSLDSPCIDGFPGPHPTSTT